MNTPAPRPVMIADETDYMDQDTCKYWTEYSDQMVKRVLFGIPGLPADESHAWYFYNWLRSHRFENTVHFSLANDYERMHFIVPFEQFKAVQPALYGQKAVIGLGEMKGGVCDAYLLYHASTHAWPCHHPIGKFRKTDRDTARSRQWWTQTLVGDTFYITDHNTPIQLTV